MWRDKIDGIRRGIKQSLAAPKESIIAYIRDKNHRYIFVYAVLIFILVLQTFLYQSYFPLRNAFAASKTWTSLADFKEWTHNNTRPFGGVNGALGNLENGSSSTYALNLPPIQPDAAVAHNTTNNSTYIFGGCAGGCFGTSTTQSNLIFEYTSSGRLVKKNAVLPAGRSRAAAAWSPTQSKAYIFGGCTGANCKSTGGYVNSILEYDPATDTIVTKSATLNVADGNFSTVWDSVNSRFIIFGGFNATSATSTIQFYNPATNVRTTSAQTLPSIRGFTSAVFVNGQSYIFGGAQAEDSLFLSSIVSYDGTNPTTTLVPTLPTARGKTMAAPTGANTALIFGGQTAVTPTYTNEILAWDGLAGTLTTSSSTLPQAIGRGSASFNTSSSKAHTFGGTYNPGAAASVNAVYQSDSSGGSVVTVTSYIAQKVTNPIVGRQGASNNFYVFGGDNGSGFTTNIYHMTATGSFVYTKSSQLANNLRDASIAWDSTNSQFLIFGGYNGSTYSNQILAYNPTTDVLTTKTATLPSARAKTSALWANTGRALIFGGYNGSTYSNEILEYNPNSDTLMTLSATLPSARAEMSAAAVSEIPDEYVYLFGGYNGSTYSNQILRYAVSGNTLDTMIATLPVGISQTTAVRDEISDDIFIFGGNLGSGLSNKVYMYDNEDDWLATQKSPSTLPSTLTNLSGHYGGGSSSVIFGEANGVQFTSAIRYNHTLTFYPNDTATIVYTPDAAFIQDWQSATPTTSIAPGGSVALEYTDNTDCSTGLTSDITTVPNSISICIKVTVNSGDVDEGALPNRNKLLAWLIPSAKAVLTASTLDDLTITFNAFGPAPTPTPTATPTSTATPIPVPTSTSTATPDVTTTTASPTPTPSSTPPLVALTTSTPTPSPSSLPSQTPSVIITPNVAPLPLLPKSEPFRILGWGAIALAAFLGLVALPLRALQPSAFPLFNIPLWGWFNLLSWRKKRYKWGRVVTPIQPDGIPRAQVYLYDVARYNRLVNRTLTDKLGQYGFLVPPGRYVMKVVHPAFRFPSQIDFSGYHGSPFTLDEDTPMIQTDIPIDPVTTKGIIANAFRTFVLSVRGLRRVLLVVGTGITIYNFTVPSFLIINLLFLAYYTFLWIDEFKSSKTKRHMLRILDIQGQPLPFSIVRLKTNDGKIIFNRAADVLGRVFILVAPGSYNLEIVTPSQNGQPARIIHQSISLPEGYLERTMTIRLRETL